MRIAGNDNGTWTSQIVGNTASIVYAVAVGDLDGDGDLDIVSGGQDNNVNIWRNNGRPFNGEWNSLTAGSHTGAVEAVAVGDLDGDGKLDIVSAGSDINVWRNDGTPFDAGWSTSQTMGGAAPVLSVAVGDLDGDGKLDIVSGGFDNQVTIWQNNGTPFNAAVPWASQTVGSHTDAVSSMAVGDLDGDGDLDIVSAGYDHNVNVWQNDGTPFSGTWASLTAGSHIDLVFAVAVGNLDGDGDLDIVSGGQDSTVKAWQNKQVHRNMPFNSTATDVGSISSTIWVLFTATGDLDGDGDLDIISAGGTGSITIWQNNGTPFAAGWSTSETVGNHSGFVRSVAVGDLDGDGDLDIASAGLDNVKIWENNGTPFDGAWIGQTVGSHTDVVGAVAVEAVAVGDLDGDGDLDIVSGGFDNNVRIWLNDGTPFDAGAWASRIFDGHTSAVMAVAVGDLDGDGNLDILSGGQDLKVMAWQNWGIDPIDETTWNWDGRTIIGSHTGPVMAVAVGDLDGDGDLDIVSSDDSSVFHGDNPIAPFSSIKVWRHNGRPFDGAGAWTSLTVGSLTDSVEAVAVGDLDGDGDLDIASAGWDKNVNVWRNDGTPFADAWASQTVGSHTDFIDSVAVGDLDGDGDLDLVSGGRDNIIKAWQNQGGSAGFAVTDTSPGTRIVPGSEDDVFKVVFTHNGITGDRDLELSQWNLNLFDDGDACSNPMDTATANSLLDKLRVRLDDGDGIFESDGSDVQVAEIDTFALAGGVQTISFTNDDANVQVSPTNSRTYWVSLLTNAPQGDICLQFDPDAGAVVEGKTPDFSVSIQDSSPTKTANSVPTAVTLSGFAAASSSTGGWTGFLPAGLLTLLAGLAVWRRKSGVSGGRMAATAQPVSRLPLPGQLDAAVSGRRPYTPPAILHELALETRAGSALSVDPLNELFGIDSK
ncbi:MAG: VCBS repeat-containing protein [Caldilineaceae bacterium]|nr:VCBS repeat-containing protein [Caldilineaceae bacterium]